MCVGSHQNHLLNVRFGSLADIRRSIRDVRFTPKADMPGHLTDGLEVQKQASPSYTLSSAARLIPEHRVSAPGSA